MNPATELSTTCLAHLVSRDSLKPDDLENMHLLLSDHFDGVTWEQFQRDVAEKNWVILMKRSERLVGFSTMLLYETSVDGKPYSIVYSGDTIVAPEAWNTSTLPRAWIGSVAKLRTLYSHGAYLWLLLTSGFRTYRFLPLFWREFFPRFDFQTPTHWKRLIDCLGSERFGEQFDPATGVVRFQHPQRLRGPLGVIPPGRKSDSHIAYFASRNPSHLAGDELVCLTELSPRNLTPAGSRAASATPSW